MNETHDLPLSKPPTPKCRRPIGNSGEKNCSQNNYHNSDMENNISRQSKLNSSESKTEDDSTDDGQLKKISDEDMKEDEKRPSSHSQNDIFSKKTFLPENSQLSICKSIKKQTTNSYCLVTIIISIIGIIVGFYFRDLNKKQTQHINLTSQFESFEKIKATFYNQESDTWNDISTAINETISRNPGNKPQIILLFANETSTMDCLATALAHVLSNVLHIDDFLELNPENFGDDAGEIIDKLKKHSSAKKVVLIRNVLNINAKAIKALHNLCDKISPLIREAIYIFTMQTNNYQSSQKKLKFVEDQFYHKLSKSIDEDILMALVTRVTDAAIISVQPEPHLRYCQS
ncbi:uncharacterized protein LOC126853224 isoform X2 [Cataglyphis hispanica]|uniref:uncharacterized protein LOC126853224 isoform X2 n=1 Tax=Cataglyphis hispanica TaxID=1086592 RepID=UPI00218042B5|nr:uncharacterized protein LOC126853224 isoform X2 [Cataglyphis hispanica]